MKICVLTALILFEKSYFDPQITNQWICFDQGMIGSKQTVVSTTVINSIKDVKQAHESDNELWKTSSI